jgi:rhodanese-related sulfurtransferase
MSWKRLLLETLTLVAAAVLCASVANLLAARERRVAFVGSYPDALKVPAPPAEAPRIAEASHPAAAPTALPATHSADTPRDVVPRAAERPAPGAPPRAGEPGARPAAAPPAPAAPRVPAADLLSRFPPHKDKPWVEVSGDDVAFLHGAGALVLDARRTPVYEEGHVAGARSISVWESDVDERVTALVNEGRDTAQPIVIYCSGGDCEDSHMLAQKLFGAGFENLLVYHDGFPDWKRRGGAIRTGGSP